MAIGNSGNLTIKDSDLERVRRRVGKAYPADPSFTTVTEDVIRRFAQYCVATENPLFSDPAYGAASPFKSIIAAPLTAAGQPADPIMLEIHPLLVRNGARTMLFDTGLGEGKGQFLHGVCPLVTES